MLNDRTVFDNLLFVLKATGWKDKAKMTAKIHEVLEKVDMKTKDYKKPFELSGGEQQRVSMARAIVATPPLVLADEPTGNLDPDNSWQIIQILRKLNSFGATVIVTTHDEHLVRRCNKRVVQVRDGKVYEQ